MANQGPFRASGPRKPQLSAETCIWTSSEPSWPAGLPIPVSDRAGHSSPSRRSASSVRSTSPRSCEAPLRSRCFCPRSWSRCRRRPRANQWRGLLRADCSAGQPGFAARTSCIRRQHPGRYRHERQIL